MENKNLTEKLKKIYDIFDVEAFYLLGGLYEITKDFEKTIDIIEKEKWFNFYTDIYCFYDLAAKMLDEDCLWEDKSDDNIATKDFLEKEEDEDKLKEKLTQWGWHISAGLAIGLNDKT